MIGGQKMHFKKLLGVLLSTVLVASSIDASIFAAEVQIDESQGVILETEENSENDSTSDEGIDTGNDNIDSVIDTKNDDTNSDVSSSNDSEKKSEETDSELSETQTLDQESSTIVDEEKSALLNELSREEYEQNKADNTIKMMATSAARNSAHMWYQYNDNIDIRGYNSENVITTTFDDIGYETTLKCDGDEELLTFSDNGIAQRHSSGLTVTPNVSFSDDGSYAIVDYTVTNTGNSTKTYSLGVCADVFIDDDDFATVYKTSNGFRMENKSGMSYFLICRNISGSTNANTRWFGQYFSRRENVFNDVSGTTLSGVDSELAFSWSNKTILAGSTARYVFQVGIGDSGAIVDYTETGKGFRIPEDTNSYNHSYGDFFDGSWVNESSVDAASRIIFFFKRYGKYIPQRKQYYVASGTGDYLKLGVAYHSQAEIKSKIASSGVTLNDAISYNVSPSYTKPYVIGSFSEKSKKTSISMLNLIRYIAGLHAKSCCTHRRIQYPSAMTNRAYIAVAAIMHPSMYQIIIDGSIAATKITASCTGTTKLVHLIVHPQRA